MNAYKILACIVFILYCGFFSACSIFKSQENKPIEKYQSYKNIPGVTFDEIRAIEDLKKQVTSFTYGMTPSAEAFYDENNIIKGYSALLCKWLTELFGIPFSPAIYIWGDLASGLETGKVDFTGELTPTDERRKTYFMTDPIAGRSLKYFRLYGSRPLSAIAEDRVLRFAILEDTTTIDAVYSLFDKDSLEIILLDNAEKVYDMLKSKTVDAYINENPEEAIFDIYNDIIAEDLLPLVYSPVSLSTQNPKLAPIISVVQKALQNGGARYLTELYNLGYQEYLKNKLFMQLSEAELEYIRSKPVVLFAAEYDNYPVSYYNKYEKKWEGIFFDVLSKVETLTGISFESANEQNTKWFKLLEMLESGKVSIISELIPSQEREGRFLWPNTAFFSDTYVLLSKEKHSNIKINEILYLKVGVIKDTAYTAWFQKNFPNHAFTVEYENIDAAFYALEHNEVDMVMSPKVLLSKLLHYHEYTHYKANFEFNFFYESKIGFNKNEAILCSIIDKSLRLIDLELISRQWMNKSFDYRQKLSQAQRQWLFGVSSLILCIAILLYVLFRKTRSAGKHLERLVHKRTAELESVSNNYKGIIWSVNKEGVITTFKGRYTKMLEEYHMNMEGTKLGSKQHSDILGIAKNVQKTFLEGPQDWISEDKDKVYHSYTTPMYDDKGQIMGVVGSTDDVTDTIKLQEAAQAASRAKSNFLSHVSHEIRTPLNAIIGMIRIGMNTDNIEKKNYCFGRTDSASKHLLGIINDILDISKIEANKFELLYTEFDFELMLNNIKNIANIRAEEKKQNLVVNLGQDVPAFILSDELRLSQVITNLLANAIKFTPEKGTIVLDIKKTEEINDEVILRIEVIDNGIGISEEQQQKLFKSFGQADANITQKFGGTGLGLAISKRIVELMGGKIWVESELDKGAKFIFTIKVKSRREKSNIKLAPNIKPEDIRILAVTDSEEKEYFVYVMQALKLSCDIALAGNQAIQMMKNDSDKPYNMFFIDWQMPDMDAIELTKKIKEIDSNNSIIIMVSAVTWSNIEKEARAAGANCFMTKPLFPSTLVSTINNCIGEDPKKSAGSAQEKPTKQNFCNHTLLIAEDVDINREIMSAILEETQASIDYALDGKMAVSMFREHPEKYSMILMDINMPEMDGYEATKTIRSLDLANAKDIPIIAMTANVFKEDIDKCIESGMNGHIGKPIDSEALFGILGKYLTSGRETHQTK